MDRRWRRRLLEWTALGAAGAAATYWAYWWYRERQGQLEANEERSALQLLPLPLTSGREGERSLPSVASSADVVQLEKNLLNHFESVQEITQTQTIPEAMNLLRERLLELTSLDVIMLQIRKLQGSSDMMAAAEKLHLWQQLARTSFVRSLAACWLVPLLALFLKIKINILGRHLYLESTLEALNARQPQAFTHGASRKPPLPPKLSTRAQEMFMHASQHFLVEGTHIIHTKMFAAVEKVIGSMALQQATDMDQLMGLMSDMLREFERTVSAQDWSALLLGLELQVPLCMPTPDGQLMTVIPVEGSMVDEMNAEVRAVLGGPHFHQALHSAVKHTTKVVVQHVENTFNLRLAASRSVQPIAAVPANHQGKQGDEPSTRPTTTKEQTAEQRQNSTHIPSHVESSQSASRQSDSAPSEQNGTHSSILEAAPTPSTAEATESTAATDSPVATDSAVATESAVAADSAVGIDSAATDSEISTDSAVATESAAIDSERLTDSAVATGPAVATESAVAIEPAVATESATTSAVAMPQEQSTDQSTTEETDQFNITQSQQTDPNNDVAHVQPADSNNAGLESQPADDANEDAKSQQTDASNEDINSHPLDASPVNAAAPSQQALLQLAASQQTDVPDSSSKQASSQEYSSSQDSSLNRQATLQESSSTSQSHSNIGVAVGLSEVQPSRTQSSSTVSQSNVAAASNPSSSKVDEAAVKPPQQQQEQQKQQKQQESVASMPFARVLPIVASGADQLFGQHSYKLLQALAELPNVRSLCALVYVQGPAS